MIEDLKLSMKLAVKRHRKNTLSQIQATFPLRTVEDTSTVLPPIFPNPLFQRTLKLVSFFLLSVVQPKTLTRPNSTPFSKFPHSIQNSKQMGQMRSDTPSNSHTNPIKNWHLSEARAPVGEARMT